MLNQPQAYLINQLHDLKPVAGRFINPTVSNSAVALVGPSPALIASLHPTTRYVQIFSTSINYRSDGTAPSSSVGFPLPALGRFFSRDEALTMQLIRSGGSDATPFIQEYAVNDNQP